MNRRFQYAVVASSTCVVLLLLFGAVYSRSASADSPYTNLGVYSEVLSRIKADYVEEPDIKAVTLGAINGMLESIDPYASYLNADQYKQYLKAKDTVKPSVGLTLSKRFGYMNVVDALPGSPAALAGMSTGDVIESINNVSTRDMPLAFAELLLQGDANSTVEMGVLRARKSEAQKMTLTRAALIYPPVSARVENGVGIIETVSLAPGRAKDIAAKIAEVEKQGAKRLILDLRHCSTGSEAEGIAVANLFMDKGLITYTQGQKMSRQDFQAASSKGVSKLPLVVAVNRGTAGAAEIAIAALLESKRADVVGEHTYGDAAVRKAITLDDGSALILSVAKYYAPVSAKAIQDTGVTPNVLQAEADAAPDADDDIPDAQDVRPPTPATSVDLIMKKAKEAVEKAAPAK